jgi:hypothetical protein
MKQQSCSPRRGGTDPANRSRFIMTTPVAEDDESTWLGVIAGAVLLLPVYRALVGRGTRGRTAY